MLEIADRIFSRGVAVAIAFTKESACVQYWNSQAVQGFIN